MRPAAGLKKLIRIAFTFFGWVLHTATLLAATNYVVNTNDFGVGSLRQAILDGNSAGGATILFSNVSGTITLGLPLPSVTANQAIRGPGTNLLTISGNNSNTIFVFNAGTTSLISGLTIANGRAPSSTNFLNGAAISNASSLTISRCLIVSNRTDGGFGGAIFK